MSLQHFVQPADKEHINWIFISSAVSSIDNFFKIRDRESSVLTEVYGGIIHFLSVCTVLALNPLQLQSGDYDPIGVSTATAIVCAFSCLLIGVIGNIPIVSTPSLLYYLSGFLKEVNFSPASGNAMSLVAGICLILCGLRSVKTFLSLSVPPSYQRGIYLGSACLLFLQALGGLHLVVAGKYVFLTLGHAWSVEVAVPNRIFQI